MNIGIIGYGFVGKAISAGFSSKCNIYINDPKFPENSLPLKFISEECLFIFVSVSTPINDKGEFDSKNIECVLNSLNDINKDRDIYDRNIVIIKSAVIPSVIKEWETRAENIAIIVSPEYLSDKDGARMFVNQKLLILGGDTDACEDVVDLYKDYSLCNMECPVGICTALEASLIKYMENSFLATKVIFMNEFYELYKRMICAKAGRKVKDDQLQPHWESIMKMFHYDVRMGTSHYQVPGPDGDFGFGGRCLPKDIRSISRDASDKFGMEMGLIDFIWDKNSKIRSLRDWDKKDTTK